MALSPLTRISPASRLRAVAKIAVVLFVSAIAMPSQWLLLRILRGDARFRLPRLWHGCLRRALGIRVDIAGRPRNMPRTLYVGNHVSHFDIPLLGSLVDARFIAKDDMERWPGLRWIGALQRTLFISRSRADAARVAGRIAAAMREGDSLLFFAEGTTSSGERVAPFKSSLFALFLGDAAEGWTLQPFTLDVLAYDGRALDAGGDRDGYAFHGDMDAGAHLRRFLRSRGARVRVLFHAPMAIPPGIGRKALAAQAHAVVASGLARPPSGLSGEKPARAP